jgi:hypothetical protein
MTSGGFAMATKAELQQAYETFERIRRGWTSAEATRDFPEVVRQTESALTYQHAAVTFQRRFQKLSTLTTPAVDVILRYAPPFFLGRSLDAVEAWYTGGTPTERKALPDIPARIATARKVLDHAVELWGVFAESPSAVLRPPANSLTAAVIPFWVAATVVAARPEDPATYVRVSDPRREAMAKCAGCGRERRAPLADLLEPSRCPACERRCEFVLVRRVLGGKGS